MKKLLLIIGFFASLGTGFSQTYITRSGYIGFFSKTPFEDIKAENRQVYAVIDVAAKNLAFTCLVKGFLFQKELMQEHFNENYIESDKYPKATFLGSYTGEVNLGKEGIYEVQIKGNLTLHGVTKPIDVPAKLTVKNNIITGASTFKLIPQDFKIIVPALVKDKIARQIEVRVLVECNPK